MMELTPARPGVLELATDAAATWRYMAPPGHSLEMCQRPDYWRNCLRELGQQRIGGRHAWNKIEIIAEDGTWEAELRVVAVGDGLVQTRLLREWSAPKTPGRKPALPDGYRVEHIEGNGWRALDPNGAIVRDKLQTEEMAVRAASQHARTAGVE